MNPADGQCLHTDSCEKFCQPFCIRGHDVHHWKHSGGKLLKWPKIPKKVCSDI